MRCGNDIWMTVVVGDVLNDTDVGIHDYHKQNRGVYVTYTLVYHGLNDI